MSKRIRTKVGLLVAASLLGACNAVTGVDDLEVTTTPMETHPYLEPLITIPGISMTDISLYQGIKVQLMLDGKQATSTVPIIAGRNGLLRVFVKTDGSYTGEPVTARVFVEGTKLPFEITVDKLPAASVESDLATTINIPIPGSAIASFTNYKVLIGKPSGPIPRHGTTLIYPASGWEAMTVHTVGTGIKLVLVPVKYDADGSGRIPDLTPDVVKRYADGFRGMYPIPDIDISVHAPEPWAQPISNSGTGWSELLDHITTLRQIDNVDSGVYYYAIFQPADTFGQYCAGGCVLGLANLADFPSDSSLRASIGVGYFGDQITPPVKRTEMEEAIETAVHEVGHTHGRHHSPSCGAQGTDPSFPYLDGKEGTLWGYNIVTNALYDPTVYYDLMGYCEPNWISDYTYNALYERVRDVNMLMPRIDVPEAQRNLTYDRILINHKGEMKWMPPLKMALPPRGEERTVVIESRLGEETITAQFSRFDHLDGGRLIWPSSKGPASAIRFEYNGKVQRVLTPVAAP